jgi:hypothetical protein
MAGTIRDGCGIANRRFPLLAPVRPRVLACCRRMNQKKLGQVALIVGLAVLSVWMFRRSSDRPRIDLNPYQVLGAVAAEETSKLLGQQGEIVLVIPDPGSDRDPVMDAQLAAFRSGLKKAGKVVVRSTETVKMDPFLSMRTGGAMPPEQFVGVLKKQAGVAALVLFIGFPALSDQETAELKTRPTKRIVISAALPGYDALIEQGPRYCRPRRPTAFEAWRRRTQCVDVAACLTWPASCIPARVRLQRMVRKKRCQR